MCTRMKHVGYTCIADLGFLQRVYFGLDPRAVELVKKFSVVLWSSAVLHFSSLGS